ncbi:hypothetical protein FHS18_002725 [Paenibacillus phyllosphaerae]|uniref:Uncharacterized protein n=1 Tax=Paenibacillus phyllosphaerae TaxID=274593 RepID=A0A7W5AXN0_9BACL|nr:hypothetical protein [Paenibacillus phyllosphaerae]
MFRRLNWGLIGALLFSVAVWCLIIMLIVRL